jgi:hypothetical protein
MSSSQTDIISHLRPRTVGEIIDGAFRLYRRNFRTFLLIVAVVYLPVMLLSYAVDIFLLGRYAQRDLSGSLSASLAASNITTQIDSLKTYLETFLAYFAQWALTVAVANAILGTPISFGDAYGEVRRRFWTVVGLIGLQSLIAIGFLSPVILLFLAVLFGGAGGSSSLLTIVLGCLSIFTIIYAIIQVRLEVIVPAAVNEELSPRQALSRSWELTRNYFWRTVALAIVIGILRAIVALGPAALIVGIVGIGFKLDAYTNLALTQGIGILTAVIFMPVEIGAIALYYYDQRVRKEGFDLDTAITQRYEGADTPGYGPAGGYAQGSYSQSVGAERSVVLGEGGAYRQQGEVPPAATAPRIPPLPPPPPRRPYPPHGTIAPVASRDVRQDKDLYPLLASRQSDEAMQLFSRRLAKIPHRKARFVSTSPKKRKVPHFPRSIPEQEPDR